MPDTFLFSEADRVFMARALELARQGIYTTMPNPSVGCVLVRGGAIIGEGSTSPAGGHHGEINALMAVKANTLTEGATAYITLEPCAHYGRTPPCAKALIKAGISRVVVATGDPNPLVNGAGLKMLEQAGIATASGLMASEAREINAGFYRRMETGFPLVRCKMAMSLDGRTAMASGESQWITGVEARADVQQWRAQSCAIVTGVGTVLEDNPALTVRAAELPITDPKAAAEKQPLRVVVDSRLRIPLDAKMLTQPGETVVACLANNSQKVRELEALAVEVLVLPEVDGRVCLRALMTTLAQRQCNNVLLETGATLAGSAIAAGLVDELLIYMAPVLMGSEGRPLFQLSLTNMAEKVPLDIQDICALGPDWRIRATLAHHDGG